MTEGLSSMSKALTQWPALQNIFYNFALYIDISKYYQYHQTLDENYQFCLGCVFFYPNHADEFVLVKGGTASAAPGFAVPYFWWSRLWPENRRLLQ